MINGWERLGPEKCIPKPLIEVPTEGLWSEWAMEIELSPLYFEAG